MIIKNEIQKPKQTILFDIDGTLVYFDTLYGLVKEALTFYGLEFNDEYYKMQTIGVIEALNKGQLYQNFNFDSLINSWEENLLFLRGTNVSAKELGLMMINLEKNYIKEVPHVKETLEYLKKLKYSLLCSTNWLEYAQREKLKTVGIDNYFDRIYSCENTYVKPDYNHFYNILQKEKTTSEKTLMIGDSFSDISCTGMGIDSVLYDPKRKKADIYDYATAVITDMLDLKRILKK